MTTEHTDPVALDIETAPSPDGMALLLANPPTFSAPSNWKDQEKIAAKVESMREEWETGLIKKASLSPMYGQIVCVTIGALSMSTDTNDETDLLRFIAKETERRTPVVTFNGSAFDGPFIRSRLLRHGIQIPRWLASSRRYTNIPHCDVRMVLTGWEQRQEGTLNDWHRHLFGEEPPAVLHPITEKPIGGADVHELVSEGHWDTLRHYNAIDVEATWRIYERLRLLGAL